MALIDEIAAKLSGRTRAEENTVLTDATTRTYVGTAVTDSADGSVYVSLSEDVTLPDDDDGEHGTGVEMPTTVGVSEGDEVLVTVFGGGTLKAPVVTGNPGWGDAVQEQVNNAETIAEQAEAVASATGQHFWPDTDGVHVTEVTQETWNDSTSPSYHSGANVLLNALGQLFRDGLNNILAILSGTTPGVAIYDGNGNAADNILAEFMADHVRIGGNVPIGEGGGGASIEFFDQTSTHTSSMDASTTIDEQPAEGDYSAYYDMRNETSITTSLDDDGRVVDTDSNGTASLQLKQELSYGLTDVDEQTSECSAAIVSDATYDADGTNPVTSHAAVRATALTGSGHSTGYSVVDIVAEQGIGIGESDAGLTYVSTPQVLVALTRPTLTRSPTEALYTVTEANGWHTLGLQVLKASTGTVGNYLSLSTGTGVFTALVGCTVLVSGNCTWTDAIYGDAQKNRRSLGFFVNPTVSGRTVTGGTENGVTHYFVASGSYHKSVTFSPKLIHLNAGNTLVAARWEPQNAVNDGRYGMTWVTVEVVAVD